MDLYDHSKVIFATPDISQKSPQSAGPTWRRAGGLVPHSQTVKQANAGRQVRQVTNTKNKAQTLKRACKEWGPRRKAKTIINILKEI